MKKAILHGCYDFNKDAVLVEMILDDTPQSIDWAGFVVPNAELDRMRWQCPYMEQYLSLEGTEKLCGTYDVPKKENMPTRVAFFLFKTEDEILSTPYGDFSIKNMTPMPERLANIIEFDEFD